MFYFVAIVPNSAGRIDHSNIPRTTKHVLQEYRWDESLVLNGHM